MSFNSMDMIESFLDCCLPMNLKNQDLNKSYGFLFLIDLVGKTSLTEDMKRVKTMKELFYELYENKSFIAEQKFLTPMFLCILSRKLSLQLFLNDKQKALLQCEIDYYRNLNPNIVKIREIEDLLYFMSYHVLSM